MYRAFQCIHSQQCPIASLGRNFPVVEQKMLRIQAEGMLDRQADRQLRQVLAKGHECDAGGTSIGGLHDARSLELQME